MAIEQLRAQLNAIYDTYRTALMNEKYYANRLTHLRKWNLTYEIFLALGTSSVIAGWSLWKDTAFGGKFWSVFGGVVAVLVVLKPVLQIPKAIEDYSKLHTGYRALYLSVDDIVSNINVSRAITQEAEILFDTAKKQYRELALTDSESINQEVLRVCQQEVNLKLPPASLWYP
jgi:hypothetical protein